MELTNKKNKDELEEKPQPTSLVSTLHFFATNKLEHTGTTLTLKIRSLLSYFLRYPSMKGLSTTWERAQRQITRGVSNPVTSRLDWIAITHRWICSEIHKRSVRLKLPFHRKNLNQPRKVNSWKVGIIMEFSTPKATHFDHRLVISCSHHWSEVSRYSSVGKHIKHEKITELWSFVVGNRFVHGECCYWSEAISVLSFWEELSN